MKLLTKVNLNKNIEEADKFCKFDFDPVPQTIEEHLKLSGWVIGIESPVVGVELIQDGQLVGYAPVTIHRPRAAKIYATFPGAEHSGFVIDLALEKINLESGEILIQAVLENFQRISLADLKLSQYSFRSPKKKTFFVHVAKTAGSSFNKFLHTYLHGNSHCESYRQSSQPWEFKNLDILKSWDFVSGHLGIQYFNKNFERDQYLLVTLLRNPFDQIISHVNWLAYIHQFDHNSRFYQSHPDHIKKMGYNLCERDLTNPLEVIDFLLENKWLLNAQSSYFKTDSNNADAIIENLLNFDLVGLTEDYSQFIKKYVSLIGLEDIIEPIVNRENINSKPALNKKELLNNSKFVDFLNDYNGVDIKVYNFFYNLHKNGLDNLPAEALSISEKSLNLKRQLNLKTELNEELEQLKIKFEQQSEQLTFVQVELEKMQQDLAKTCSELQETKEELQRSQSQFDEVLAELEETHLQLHQTEAELKQSPSQLQQIQTEFPKTQTNAIQPLNDRPKCQLSICAILKDEGLYIIEWLEFHKIVGVERFYLYDNNSTDNIFEKVKPYIDRGEIVWHEWPEQGGQNSSYNHCLKHHREESEWIAFIDLDEFLFPSEADDLKKVLEEYKEYPGIGVNWLCFGSSGHITKPKGLVTENFTRRPLEDEALILHNGRMKSIIRPTQTIRSATPHHFIYVDDQQAVTENHQVFVGPQTSHTSVKKLRINHYLTKSREEFRIKSNRGAGNGTKKQFAVFEKYDQNQIEDLTIQRFVPVLKSAIESASNSIIFNTENMKEVNHPISKNHKVFCIGLSKTGTTSLTVAMKVLGYKTKHYLLEPDKDIPAHEFLSDMPIQTRYQEYDIQYPGSKFILSVRDKKSWLNSCMNHFRHKAKQQNSIQYKYRIEQTGVDEYDEDIFSQKYDQHLEDVKEYFKHREADLLILNICEGDGWDKLCAFLGKEIPKKPFPRANVSRGASLKQVPNYQEVIKEKCLTTFKTLENKARNQETISQATTNRLGIGVITYNRLKHLKKCVESIRKYTTSPYYLVIADDGSTDGTVEWCRSEGLVVLTGQNRGVCWNKNRALYALKEYTDANCIMLLEDDCFPIEKGWELAWLETTAIWHHVNYAAPWILEKRPHDIYKESGGMPTSPDLLKVTTGQCTTSSRHALNCVGYLDSRFKGYGFGHAEWTQRFMRFSAVIDSLPLPIYGLYPAINQGLMTQKSKSHSNQTERRKNAKVLESLNKEPTYRFPWQNTQEQSVFIQEVSSAQEILFQQVSKTNSAIWVNVLQPPSPQIQISTAQATTTSAKDVQLPTPRMSEAEVKLFTKYLQGQKVVIEFGAGGSTGLAIKTGVKQLYSVESDFDFINKLQEYDRIQKAVENSLVQFFHINIGPVGAWGYPRDQSSQENWPRYYSDIWKKVPDPINLVFIDGRFRVACALQSLSHINTTTKVIMHDFWDRPPYHDVLKFFDPIESADTLVVLQPKEKFDQHLLSAMIEQYKYITA